MSQLPTANVRRVTTPLPHSRRLKTVKDQNLSISKIGRNSMHRYIYRHSLLKMLSLPLHVIESGMSLPLHVIESGRLAMAMGRLISLADYVNREQQWQQPQKLTPVAIPD